MALDNNGLRGGFLAGPFLQALYDSRLIFIKRVDLVWKVSTIRGFTKRS